ncbi:MAG: SDR family oxidoreductase [Acidobacteria bacterium]|nr:SDR family oxidoreductase [Acidobacteriota bacterium]MCW5967238.1 SDR family oxidoreductase [Blastocatellales bacterium]
MLLKDKVAVVTGGGHGIGRALCLRFAAEGARGVVVADIDANAATEVAKEIGGLAISVDVSNESDIIRLVAETRNAFGEIDIFCSNAGIGGMPGGIEVSNEDWERIFGVNVLHHIYAARAVIPAMLERGEGYLLQTVSAAGLLTQIGSAPYSVTKHAALAFAEWLSITYGDRGVRVSALCPQGVLTRMLQSEGEAAQFLRDSARTPDEVADAVVAGLAEERFLILPHPEVGEYFRRKADDYDRWLRGMRRLQQKVFGGG